MLMMIKRTAHDTLLRLSKGFPIVSITGPRQSGKSTLAKMAFPDKPYLTFDDVRIAEAARKDPMGLLAAYPDGCIIDEAQKAPDVFPYLKLVADREPVMGRFIITGSQQFHLMETITESLAGRVANITLLPFSVQELEQEGRLPENPDTLALTGFYPPLYDRAVSHEDWYQAYVSSYVMRDISALIQVSSMNAFQTFLIACAVRSGEVFNLTSIAQDCGISVITARKWLSILQTSSLICLIYPYMKNFGKRMIKSPKLYFLDTGLLCYLLNIADEQGYIKSPSRGHVVESMACAELMKACLNRGRPADLSFWRDSAGNEVDFIMQRKGEPYALEVKASRGPSADFTKGIRRLQDIAKPEQFSGKVLYLGDITFMQHDMEFVSWRKWGSIGYDGE